MSTIHAGPDGSYAIFDCPRAEYDAIDAVNQSLLKKIVRSSSHLHHAMLAPKKPPSEAMTLGCLVEHLTIGTPFDYAVSPFDDFLTKEAKAWKKEKKAAGIPILKHDMIERAHKMSTRVLSCEWFQKLKPFRTNICLVARHEETGLMQKGLVDLAPEFDLMLGDVKTTEDAAPTERGFGLSIATYGYDIQGVLYQRLWNQVFGELRTWVLIAVESEAPFETSNQPFRQEDLDRAGRAWDGWMRTYRTCLDSGQWPGYGSELTWAIIPAWRFKEL